MVTIGNQTHLPGKRQLPKLKLSLNQKRTLWAYIFVAVPFAYFMVVNFSAMFQSFLFSFQDYVTIRADRSFIGLDNYDRVFQLKIFRDALRNTLVIAAVRVPILTVLSLGVALMLHNIRWAKGLFRTLYFIPFVTSGVAIAWVFKFMLLPNNGLFTHLFDMLGIPRVYFLGDPRTALGCIIGVTVWAGLGYYALIFLAGLEDIPHVFYEAATVDGASAWQCFWKITIPLLNRTLVLVILLILISSLQSFTYVRMMSKDGFGGPLNSTITIPVLIYKEAFFSMQMGRASAIAVVFFVIVLVITLIQQKLLSREVEY